MKQIKVSVDRILSTTCHKSSSRPGTDQELGAVSGHSPTEKKIQEPELEKARNNSFDDWFEDSTHRFLLSGKCGALWLVSFMILCIQFSAYLVMVVHTSKEIMHPRYALTTTYEDCQVIDRGELNFTTLLSPSNSTSLLDEVTCDYDPLPKEFNVLALFVYLSILAAVFAVLLTTDLALDFLGTSDLLCPKCTRRSVSHASHTWPVLSSLCACFILLESLLAYFTGLLFAMLAINEGNSADAIMNCVAVLFLHEIDEKMYHVLQRLDERGVSAQSVLWLLYATYIFFLAMWGIWLAYCMSIGRW